MAAAAPIAGGPQVRGHVGRRTMKMICFVIVACSILFTASAENFFWGETVVSALVLKSQKIFENPSSIKDYFFATKFLLTQKDRANVCDCDQIGRKRQLCSTSKDYYYLISSEVACGCSTKRHKPAKNAQEDDFELPAYEILLETAQNNVNLGKVESWVEKVKGRLAGRSHNFTAEELHAILETILALKSNSHIESLASEVFAVASRRISASGNEASSDPTLLYYLKSFKNDVGLSQAQVNSALETLSHLKYVSDPEVYYKGYESVAFLNSLASSPRSLFLQSTVFQVNERIVLRLQAVDLLGNQVPLGVSRLTSFKRIGKDVANLDTNELVNGEIDLSGVDLQAGRYVGSFEVRMLESESSVKFQSPVLVQEKSPKLLVRAGISASKHISKDDLQEITTEIQLSGSVSASSLEYLHVSAVFAKKTRLHQISLKFTSKLLPSSSVLYSLSRVDEESDLNANFRIGFGDEIEKFDYQSGVYMVSLIFGDLSLNAPIEWQVGELQLSFPPKPIVNLPLYSKALLHTSDITLQKLPEIEHQMRAPAKRASKPTSYLFTALVFLPLIILLFSLLRLKPSLKRLTSFSSLIATGLFSALLTLYGGYWLGLTGMSFYETIKYLCFIYPALAFFGRSCLISVMEKRLQDSTKNH